MVKLRKFKPGYPEERDMKRLYKTAFPKEERCPYFMLTWGAKHRNGVFYSIFNDDSWCGLAYVINDENMAYVFFLAIDDKVRGMGCGSKALSILKKIYKDKKLFLAIESTSDPGADNFEERISRQHFYEKNGFTHIDGFQLREVNMVYDIMSSNGTPTSKEFRRLCRGFLGLPLLKVIKMDIISKE